MHFYCFMIITVILEVPKSVHNRPSEREKNCQSLHRINEYFFLLFQLTTRRLTCQLTNYSSSIDLGSIDSLVFS